MEGTAEYARRTERIKNLLSSYYGAEENQQPSEGQGAGDSLTPAQSKGSFSIPIPAMDSPAFNADKHISQMLKSYTLEKMMSEHHNMAREIKNLDSDMQQLVYENYNKFIAATDTIRAMKTNVDGMGGDMERLKTIIGAWEPVQGRWACRRRRRHAWRPAAAAAAHADADIDTNAGKAQGSSSRPSTCRQCTQLQRPGLAGQAAACGLGALLPAPGGCSCCLPRRRRALPLPLQTTWRTRATP
jgi:hypothetical protein